MKKGALTEGNKPKEGIMAENGDQVAAEAQVVRHLVVESVILLVALLTELDRGELARD